MACGDIYLHASFKFTDGTFGKKFFVVIYEPSDDNTPYLILKTTSNKRDNVYNTGCNEKLRSFYIPQGTCPSFPIDTIIQLEEIFEMSVIEFLKGAIEEDIINHKGCLKEITFRQLINCIKKLRDDISEKHYNLIK